MALLIFGVGLSIVGGIKSQSISCGETGTCSPEVQYVKVIDCEFHTSYCAEETDTGTASCSSDAAGCSAAVDRYTCCPSPVNEKCGPPACPDSDIDCCSGSGGNGGPGALPVCNPGEVVIDDVPEVRECISRGDCLWGPDGTGGIAGRLTGESECATNPLRYPCIRGHCGLPCSCTTTPGQCGNTINGCGYEQRVQVKDCTPAGCEMQARPFVHSRL